MVLNFRRILFPVAIAWALVNLAGLGWAVAMGEGMHGGMHAALAVAFGWWAVRLRPSRDPKAAQDPMERDKRVAVLEDEVSELQRRLSETQEGLNFTEQLLAKRPQPEPADALRFKPRQPDEQARRADDSEPTR